LGAFYKERGQYREALKSFQKTVQLAPGEHAGHYALATVYIALGQFVDAERELRLALDLGETAVVLNALGASLTYQSRDQEAIPYITRALSRYPERYLWWLNLGTAYRRLNIITDAERAYRRAFELAEAEMANNPRNGYARACLAYVAAWLGDRRRAESEIAQALQFSSTDNDTRRMAVKTYEALRKRDDSLAVLAASPPDVIADVSRYPDLADLRADRRFIKLLAAHEETHAH
jgi:Tfp pilus assembly protein PilF